MSTEPGGHIVFGPYRLDPDNQELWRGEQLVALQPKPLAVLQYLAERPGEVVSSKELLTTIWAGTIVTKAVVKECLRAIRGALREDVATPQCIETVGREGYRFIPSTLKPHLSLESSVQSLVSEHQSPDRSAVQTLDPRRRTLDVPVVGREAELAQLHQWLDKALQGQPQLVFVTGEPGIGKTTLVDRFREQLRTNGNLTIGRGQCVEQYGGGEAYLPILEALSRLCREVGGQNVIATLRQYAPTWLIQLSGVVPEEERQTLQLQVQGATQQRMLREMAEAVEAGTARRPLVLILEDLHWSDQATVELLSYLAQRRERAHILIVATYRPADLVTRNHPLKAIKQELHAKGQCEELRVELLSKQEVGEYLSRRFPQHQFPPDLAAEIHQRTEGNALFMVNVVEELLQQEHIIEEGGGWSFKGDLTQLKAPDTLRQLIEKQLQQRSDEEQRVLEVASIIGTEFAVAAVAAALKQDLDVVEEICEDLAWQGHFLEERGVAEWPDGTMSGRYAFRHALYQNTLYERVAEARRVRLHRLIGERLEAGYREQAKEIAAELAVHFEQGRDYPRAIRYLEQAGKNAIQRSAHQEVIRLLTKGLELLQTLPDTSERVQQELTLQLILSDSLMATAGYTASDVEKIVLRIWQLSQQTEETVQLLPVLIRLWRLYFTRGELQTAREVAERLRHLAQSLHDPFYLSRAYVCLGSTLYALGEFTSAWPLLEQVNMLYDPQKHPGPAVTLIDLRVNCLSYLSWTLWHLGYLDQARKRSSEALSLATELSHPFSLATALAQAAVFHLFLQEEPLARERAETAITLSTNHGFPSYLAIGTIVRSWVLVEQGQVEEGIAQMCQMHLPGLSSSVLAQAYGKVGQIEKGLLLLTEALALIDRTGGRTREAELYRLRGELTLQKQSKVTSRKSKVSSAQHLTPSTQEAEGCFLKAIEVSQSQQAKSLELRATMSLARLWRQQGKQREAYSQLSNVYNWFTEGFDTKDLQEAKALIEELSH